MEIRFGLGKQIQKEVYKIMAKVVEDKVSPQLEALDKRIDALTEGFLSYKNTVTEYFLEFQQLVKELQTRVDNAASMGDIQVKIDQMKESLDAAEDVLKNVDLSQFDPTPEEPLPPEEPPVV